MAKMAALLLAIIAAVVVAWETTASAQDFDLGKSEFQSSCASCHGNDGKGNGPLSHELKVPPADLTVLAKKNNGVLPVSAVYEVIDGRQAVLAHGTRDMPIWGNRYTPSQVQQSVREYSFYDPEAIVRARTQYDLETAIGRVEQDVAMETAVRRMEQDLPAIDMRQIVTEEDVSHAAQSFISKVKHFIRDRLSSRE